jgi:hypothetical protein
MAEETVTEAPKESEAPEIMCAILLIQAKEGDPIEIHVNPELGRKKARVPNLMETYRVLSEAKLKMEAEIFSAHNTGKMLSALAQAQGAVQRAPLIDPRSLRTK